MNNKGLTLIEILTVLGMMSIVSFGFLNIMMLSSKASSQVGEKQDVDMLRFELQNFLENATRCGSALAGVSVDVANRVETMGAASTEQPLDLDTVPEIKDFRSGNMFVDRMSFQFLYSHDNNMYSGKVRYSCKKLIEDGDADPTNDVFEEVNVQETEIPITVQSSDGLTIDGCTSRSVANAGNMGAVVPAPNQSCPSADGYIIGINPDGSIICQDVTQTINAGIMSSITVKGTSK